MNFASDQPGNGLKLRALSIVDVYTHEYLAIEPGQHLTDFDVVRTLEKIIERRGTPKMLFCDNGTEFTSHAVDL